MHVKIGNHIIGEDHPTYFIADISANHDGDLDRAKLLIRLAKVCRSGCSQVPEFPRCQDRFGLRFHRHERAGFSPGNLEEICFPGLCGCLDSF